MDLSHKRVLVTGGLGFIGSNLALRCLEQGAEVTIYDCLDPRAGGNMHNVSGFRDHVRILSDDIRDFDGICAAIVGQDILFNCAAYTSHTNSMKDPWTAIDVNCKGVINLLEAARRFNTDVKIVHVGTSTQTGKMRYSPIDENHPEFPRDIYSANKTASEKYVLVYGHAYGMNATVVRLPNVFGPRAWIRTPDFGFVNYFIGLALQGKELTVFGDGAQRRNVVYVDDCVSALVLAAQSEKSNGEVLFAVGDRQHTVAEVAESISENIGGVVKYIEWPPDRKSIEIGDAVISNKKLRSSLNWVPQTDLEEGLIRTREYFTPCLEKYL